MFGELATCGGNSKDLALLRADCFVRDLNQGCSKPWALVGLDIRAWRFWRSGVFPVNGEPEDSRISF